VAAPRVFNPFSLTLLAWLHSISPWTLQFEEPSPSVPSSLVASFVAFGHSPEILWSPFPFSSHLAPFVSVQVVQWCSAHDDAPFPWMDFHLYSISVLLTLYSPPRIFPHPFGIENLHQLSAIAAFLMMTTTSGWFLCVFTAAFVAFVEDAAGCIFS